MGALLNGRWEPLDVFRDISRQQLQITFELLLYCVAAVEDLLLLEEVAFCATPELSFETVSGIR